MAHRITIPSYAAIPAILALAGAAFVMKPEELRRDPLLEAQGMIGMAAKYEVMYARCANNTGVTATGAAKVFSSGFSRQFPARSDEDAAHFVVKAQPQCDVASLYRLDPRLARSPQVHRYRRTRIEV